MTPPLHTGTGPSGDDTATGLVATPGAAWPQFTDGSNGIRDSLR